MIHTAYGERAEKILYKSGDSRTKQSMKNEVDVNFIVKKYQKQGTLDHLKKYEGSYGEFADIDYHKAMTSIAKATEMFDDIPSTIRAKFNNDPGDFLKFATNNDNHEEMVTLGLAFPTTEPPKSTEEPPPKAPSDSITEPPPS